MANKYQYWVNIQRKGNQQDMSKRHLNVHVYYSSIHNTLEIELT